MSLPTQAQVEAAAGRELDALVAEHLFGWRWRIYASWERDKPGRKYMLDPESLTVRAVCESHGDRFATTDEVIGLPWLSDNSTAFEGIGFAPEYSTDHNAAALVLKQNLEERLWRIFNMPEQGRDPIGDVWSVTCAHVCGATARAECKSLPEAIAKAALLAVIKQKEAR